jgi:hypothetical protein
MSDNASSSDSSQTRPQDNLILGGELQVSLFKKRLVLKAEMEQSYHTYDKTLQDGSSISNQNQFAQNIGFAFNSTSHTDRAYNLEMQTNLFDGNTILKGYYKYIGAGYMSLALPFLLRGVERYEGHLSQYLWKRQISLGAFIRNDADNVFANRTIASYNNSVGVDVGLNIKKLPRIKISFAPTTQQGINTESGERVYQSKLYMTSINLSHSYNIKSVSCLTSLNATKFIGNIGTDVAMQRLYYGDNLTLQQNIQFKEGMGVNGSYSLLSQSFDKEAHVVVERGSYINVVGTYKYHKSLTGNVGYSHTTAANYPTRDNFFVENAYKIFGNIGLRLRVNYAIQDGGGNGYFNSGFGARVMVVGDW